jgi:hypothetical protein
MAMDVGKRARFNESSEEPEATASSPSVDRRKLLQGAAGPRRSRRLAPCVGVSGPRDEVPHI